MPNQFKRLARRVTKMASQLDVDSEDAADRGATDVSERAATNLRAQDSVASRELIASLDTDNPTPTGTGVIHSARAIPRAGHAAYVEKGTGAFSHTDSPVGGFPPPSSLPEEKIQLWINLKGISGDFYSATPDEGETASPLAWAIKRTIDELGNRPHPYLGPAFRDAHPRIVEYHEQAVSNAVRDL